LATPLLRCFSSLIDVPVYTRWTEGKRFEVCNDDNGNECKRQQQYLHIYTHTHTHALIQTQAAESGKLLALSQIADHFCFQYEIIDSDADSSSKRSSSGAG